VAVIEQELKKLSVATPADPMPRLWTRDEYYRMADFGILGPDDRVELIRGEILTMAPVGPEHGSTSLNLYDVLRDAAGSRFRVLHELPIILSDKSEPQPDIAVAKGGRWTYRRRHPGPADLVLVVETAHTTLLAYRTAKLQLYAEAGIPEYWIVNLLEQQVEVHTQPSGQAYAVTQVYRSGDTIDLGFAPGTSVAISDILGDE